MRKRHPLLALAIAALVVVGGSTGSASAGPSSSSVHVSVVVSGLDNPRDLDMGPGGVLYVAEAGHGGSQCLSGGPEGTTCAGLTSKISIVNVGHHSVRRIVTGLASTAGRDGSFATGVDGISVLGPTQIYGIETGARDFVGPHDFTPFLRARLRAQLGHLIQASTNGSWHAVADVGHPDFVWAGRHKNLVPGQFPDANPYGVFATKNAQWVVDAGTNTIDRVDATGVHILQFIPNPPSSDAVPTCIDRGPDGAFYIGQLTGGGNPPGSANVWRFAPWEKHRLTVWARGLTAVTGCGFDNQGDFVVVEFSSKGLDHAAPGTGRVIEVVPHSSHHHVLVGGLNFPGGFAAGSGDSFYVSNWSIAPAKSVHGSPTGQVLRIDE
jgi:hypothetical protein